MARRRQRFPNATGPAVYVLEASAALPWVVRRLSNTYSDALYMGLWRAAPIVPECWLLDVAQTALELERLGWYPTDQVLANLTAMDDYPILVDDQLNRHAWGDILTLARTHHLCVYDAAYLELALRRKLPLATTDATLTAAATAAGVSIFIL